MNLSRFLKDEARRVFVVTEESDAAEGEWVDGEPVWVDGEQDFDERRGPWFRALLQIQQPRQFQPTGRGVYVALEGDAELLFGTRDRDGGYMADPDGNFTAFSADDQIEVNSKQLGRQVWQVNTGAEPLRTVRGKVIGYRVGLKRISDETVERG